MTEEEKEDFEMQEAEDLLNFADGLDYDKYIGDLEFREGLEAVRDRAGKLMKEQNALKDQLVKDLNAGQDDDDLSTEAPELDLEDGIDGSSIADSCLSEGALERRRRRREQRRNADGRPEWDASTSCGDSADAVLKRADAALKDAASSVLESSP